jgi:putative endonuclease
VYQHREKLLPGFTNRYNVSKLAYYEAGYDASGAIARERQIKAGSRQKKIDLINSSILNGTICTMICNEIASRSLSSGRTRAGLVSSQ